jgi:plastocyanin
MHIHDIFIGNLFDDGDFYEDFEDGNLIHEDSGLIWCIDCEQGDHYWEQYDAHQWIQSFPAGVDNALVWCTEIEDAYEAYFEGMWSYDIGAGTTISVELSADGGQTWFIIALVEGPATTGHGAIPCATPFDLTPWAGQEICIRVRVQGGSAGFINVSDFVIAGKQDRMPPTIEIALSGNNIGGNMYAGPVTVKITADDDMGMGEIHYILDGTESVVSGDTATFTVSGDGSHSVEAWGVDATGNEGAHASASFSIDASPPTVAITAPEPGLYLFGSKLLSMSKPFIIGAFTIEATADDAQGVYVVQFMLNGEVIGEDTEAPYDTYCAVKNMGGATLKAVAIDGVGNTAEDTLDVTYYKFL